MQASADRLAKQVPGRHEDLPAWLLERTAHSPPWGLWSMAISRVAMF